MLLRSGAFNGSVSAARIRGGPPWPSGTTAYLLTVRVLPLAFASLVMTDDYPGLEQERRAASVDKPRLLPQKKR